MQGRGSIYLSMVLQPLDRSLGASPFTICHLCIIFILMLFLFFSLKFFLHITLSKTCQASPSQAERKPLTSVVLFILVCNIVYVSIAALYHLYRLLKDKKCIGYVISRYLKA